MKYLLLLEILEHLKLKHGIFEIQTAEWYEASTEIWAKQYCILIWDEYGTVSLYFNNFIKKHFIFLILG